MLALSLLGPFVAYLEERPLTQINSQKAQALLIYLAVEARQVHQRDSLMTLLWPDYPLKSAQQSLRQTLYLLRQTVEPEESNLILAERFTVGLNPDLLSLDVEQFEQLAGNGRSSQDWQQAVDLYRGHFLSDFYLPDSDPFEEWAASKRAYYQRQMQDLLQRLVDHYLEVGDDLAAETAVRRQLTLDNLQEAAHRQLIQILARNGRRQEALTHYNHLHQLLQDELAIEPEPETIALMEVIRAGALSGTPPLTGSQSVMPDSEPAPPKHNLPQRLTSFVGREKEIEAISRLIMENRLVTLTGVGGIGKTNLSLQVGHKMLDTFPDGVWFAELASVTAPELVAQTAAHTLGLRAFSDTPILEVLLNYLGDKTSLLILDNCEHVIDAAAKLVATVLQACPGVKILASSREALAVPGEMSFQVPPLIVPSVQQHITVDEWPEYEAIRLFVDRATAVLPHFQITPDNITPIVQICQRLDGIPLALELASARVKMLTTAEIAQRLDDRFHLLTGGSRTAVPRQQTLRALIDWSWELLTKTEQTLLGRLSIFAGGIALEAAETVCSDDEVAADQILDLLTQLVNKSLVNAERKQGQQTRYHLLDTVRQYAQEKLWETGSGQMFSHRHLAYFLQMSQEAERELMGPNQVEWLDRLQIELDNIRAARKWAYKNDVEKGLHLMVNLWEFWGAHGYLQEGEEWLAQLLAQAKNIDAGIKAKALIVQANLHFYMFNIDAEALLKESLAIFRALENQEGIALSLQQLGFVTDDFTFGQDCLEESLAIYRALNNKLGEARVLETRGFRGEAFPEAREYLEESFLIYKQAGHLAGIASVAQYLGEIACYKGDYEAAQWWLEQGMIQNNLLSNLPIQSWNRLSLGKLYFRLQEYEKAQKYYRKSIFLGTQTGNKVQLYWASVFLGHNFLAMGDLAQAQAILGESQQQFKKINNRMGITGVVFATEGLAMLAVRRQQPEQAARLFGWADATRGTNKEPRPPVEQADVDRETQTILQMIGEEAYAAAYAAGRAMTMEEAVALAVGDDSLES